MSFQGGQRRGPPRHRSRLSSAGYAAGSDPKKQRIARQEQGSRPGGREGLADEAAIQAREAFLRRWDASRRRRLWRRREELERTDVREARPVLPQPPWTNENGEDLENRERERERERERDRDRDRDRDHGGALPISLGVPPATSPAAKRQSHRVRQLLLYRKSLLSVMDDNRGTFQGRAYWTASSSRSTQHSRAHQSPSLPAVRPNRRAAPPLCSMCAYWGSVACTLCGDPVCGLECLKRFVHVSLIMLGWKN